MNISNPIWRTALCLALAAWTLAAPAAAQSYPSKPIKFVTNFPAGGPADFLARSVGEFITSQTKQPVVVENKPGAGSGSPGHLAAEIFMDAANIKIQHVPYKGNTPAVTAVLAGEVDAGVLATPGMLPHVKTGKITALAVTSRQRSRSAADVPTVAELGLKDLELEVLYVAMVPAATPEPVVQLLQKAFTDALKRPDTQGQLAGMDLFYEGLIGSDAVKRLSDQSQRYGRVVKSTGMKVD